MCKGCYEGYKRPSIFNEKTRFAANLIRRVYDFNECGGNLHAELDDWNLEDVFFTDEFSPYDPDVSIEQLNAEKECYLALKDMTFEERLSALAIAEGILKELNE